MKLNFNFNAFAVALSVVLLELATLRPAQEPAADYAALPAAPPARPLLWAVRPACPVVASPRHLVAAVRRR